MATPSANPPGSEQTSLIEYPCVFPIKVMGLDVEGFEPAMLAIARESDASFDAATTERRPSSSGKYLGLTLHVRVQSREQLDALYMRFTGHEMVKVVL